MAGQVAAAPVNALTKASPVKTKVNDGADLSDIDLKVDGQKVVISSADKTPVSSPLKASPLKTPVKEGEQARTPLKEKQPPETPQQVRLAAKVLNSPTTERLVAERKGVSPRRRQSLTQGIDALRTWMNDPDSSPVKKKAVERCRRILIQTTDLGTKQNGIDTATGQRELCQARDLQWFIEFHDGLLELVEKSTKPGEVLSSHTRRVFINTDHLTSATVNGTGWHLEKPGDPNNRYIDRNNDMVVNADSGVYLTSFQLPFMPNKKYSSFFAGFAGADDLVKALRQAIIVSQFGNENFLMKVVTPAGKEYFVESATHMDDDARHYTLYPIFRCVDLTGVASSTTVDIIKTGEWKGSPTYRCSKKYNKLKAKVNSAIKYFNRNPTTISPIRYRDGDIFYVDIAPIFRFMESQAGRTFPVAKGILVKLDYKTFSPTQQIQIQTAFFNAGL